MLFAYEGRASRQKWSVANSVWGSQTAQSLQIIRSRWSDAEGGVAEEPPCLYVLSVEINDPE
jgi:hypothetical protein